MNKEINQKEEKLYKDTIDLYEQKKQYSLLITLFLKVYEKKKELCKHLIEIFFRINDKENNDKTEDLKKANFDSRSEEVQERLLRILQEKNEETGNSKDKIYFYKKTDAQLINDGY